MNGVSAAERSCSEASSGPAAWMFRRMTGRIGAEVSGCDLARVLSDAEVAALSDALVKYKVLFFRDQPLTTEQHLALARRFGPLEVHPFTKGANLPENDAGQAEAYIFESTADKPQAADSWHSDVVWRREPSLGSILRCEIATDHGGDTLWADMAAVFEGLDDATRSRLSGMTAIHDWWRFRQAMREGGTPEEEIARLERDFPPMEHPLVRTHPVSGEKILYVNPSFTVGIKGMAAAESGPLLERLYRETYRPEVQVRFRWAKDSVAFWDNRSTQHMVVADFFPQHRRMVRVTIMGDRPY